MNTPNLRIIGIEGKEIQVKDTETFSKKIMNENLPNIKEKTPIKMQECRRASGKKLFIRHNNQNIKCTEKQIILRVIKGEIM